MRWPVLVLSMLVLGLAPGSAAHAEIPVDAPSLDSFASQVAWYERTYGVDLAGAQVESLSVGVPLGALALASYGVDGFGLSVHARGGAPAAADEERIGCVASGLGLPNGWVDAESFVCEPDVEQRTWLTVAPTEVRFMTSGLGVGSVDAVNFPDPFVPARHGIFILWCQGTGTGTLASHTVTCSTLRIGLPLAQYDHWSSHVGLDDGVGQDQALSAAFWTL